MHHSKPALLALLALTAGVHAAGEGSDSRFSLGIAAGYTGGVYKDYDGNHWHAAPLLHYESPRIYLDGASAGVKLYTARTRPSPSAQATTATHSSRTAAAIPACNSSTGANRASMPTSATASIPATAACKPPSRRTSPATAKARKSKCNTATPGR